MKDSKLKKFLYTVKIIPLYSKILCMHENRKKVRKIRRENPNRWYLKFLPIQKNKIVFDNFLGKGYGDNPKAIAEEIIRQNLAWDLVWLTKDYHKDMPKQIRQVKYGSSEAMREMASAKMWIFNVRNVKHPPKKKKQIYLQTWHGGFPLKLIEKQTEDTLSAAYVNSAKQDGNICNAILSSSSFFSKILENYFWLNDKTEILTFGVPSNDIWFQEENKEKIKSDIIHRYNISENQKIILYAPTFRDSNSAEAYNLDIIRVIEAFNQKFLSDCVLLLRFHPNIQIDVSSVCNDKIKDVSDYAVFDEILISSDVLISDYSGVIVHAIYLAKPTFIYASDIDEYSRGFNSLYEELPCPKSLTNDKLVESILQFDDKEYANRCQKFIEKVGSFNNGMASMKTVKWIKEYFP